MLSRLFRRKPVETDKDTADEFCKDGGKETDVVIFNALEVTDFSSQYGGETSISYSACNLAGRGNIYPSYGDFTQACVFRTYGPWWDMAPSRTPSFKRTPRSFCSQDYIELAFQSKVYPSKLEIYETYNPGCVVKILACENSDDTDVDTGRNFTRWKTLWKGNPIVPPPVSRMFCPPLEPCPFPTNLLRLELCHKFARYYTELDYVVLYGNTAPEDDELTNITSDGIGDTEPQVTMLMKRVEKLILNSKSEPHVRKQDENDSVCDKVGQNQIQGQGLAQSQDCIELGVVQRQISEGDEILGANGYFDQLPEEVIQLILSFLDVLSLCRVARTSRLLYKHSYDSLQYTELNLQPHWPQVNNMALESLHERSRFLQRLNLSWCHQNIVSETAFCRYIKVCGRTLRDLYLSSCSFVTSQSIHQISVYCPNLKELDVGSCKQIHSDGFYDIANLKLLERLNLYRTDIEQQALLRIIRSCPEIQHLNLGSVSCVVLMDEVLLALSENSIHLKSLDLWRCNCVSSIGVSSLARCKDLEELDLGWCSDVKSSTQCIIDVVKNCLNLKKLFLTANRTICDNDLQAVSEYSTYMEQLDILGTRLVSADTAQRVLEKCEHLKFFDVSFCSGIDNQTVKQWSHQFPNVAIKKSFQNTD